MKQRSLFDDAHGPPPIPGQRVHDFQASLAASEAAHMEAFWEACYRIAFSNISQCVSLAGDTAGQRQGKDRLLYLANGQALFIQEKVRLTRRDDSDILIEYEHKFHDGRKKSGWIMLDLDIHYLAYAFLALRRVYLFPWHSLRRAWAMHGNFWITTYGTCAARNTSYHTHSCPVPTRELRGAVARAARIDLDEG